MSSQEETKPESGRASASEYIAMRVQLTPSTQLDLRITGPLTAAVKSRLIDIVSAFPISEPFVSGEKSGKR
ncbi:MAG: hypothetical protein IPP13_22275 [Kouleothrix sp.]|jgi:hypothetical protein|nr:hypothetical protein [Kouleothrix sp.]